MSAPFQEPSWYRDSPDGWEVSRFKAAFDSIESGVWGDDPYEDETSTPVLRSNEIDEGGNWRVTEPARRQLSNSEKVKALLRDGDLLLVKSSGSHAHIGKTAVVTKQIEDLGCCFSNFTARIRALPHRANSRFLWYYLNNSPGRDQLFYHGTTTTGLINLSATTIGIGKLMLPPLPEQQHIAAYLDASCAAIDAAVTAKRRQLETLDALRKSIIHKAVTRGLDESVKLKNSGVDWIGKIPSHWKVKRIKRYAQVKRGASPRPIADPIYFDDDGEYAWVRIADVSASGRYLKKTTQVLSELGASLSVKQLPGDLIISIAGTVGKPIITSIKCCVHDGFIWFDRPTFNKDYIYFIFMSEAPYQGLGKLGTQLNLNTDTIGQIFIPEPPINELTTIINFLNRKTAEIDSIQTNIYAQVKTLDQYRKSLIHECVTGQRRITEADMVRSQLSENTGQLKTDGG